MHGFALALVGFTLAAPVPQKAELPADVYEINTRDFAMPLELDAKRKEKIECVRLYTSTDQGLTWTHQQDYTPGDTKVIYTAPRDGLYWFALEVVFKDGKRDPAKLKALEASMKVYVNTGETTVPQPLPVKGLKL